MKILKKNQISGPHKDLSIYIHIPFCEKICPYCDFNKYSKVDELIPDFTQSLIKEIQINSKEFKNSKIVTISLGGGTPSYINNQDLISVFDSIKNNYYLDDEFEFSIEINPTDLDDSKLELYEEIGINRVSVGGQSFDNKILKKLGRNHDSEILIKSLELLSNSYIDNINLDLIFGVPSQTLTQWENSLKMFLNFSFPHLSTYLLTFEPKTKFYRNLNQRRIFEPKENEIINMFNLTKEILNNNNYSQYEISNWAKKDRESIHNLRYWNSENYLGFGPGSSSHIDGRRMKNISSLKKYIQLCKNKINPDELYSEISTMTEEEKMIEYVMLNLRLKKGIEHEDFQRKFNNVFNLKFRDMLEELNNNFLIKSNSKSTSLTNKGKLLSDYIFSKFTEEISL
ncbi:MAG: radical SAM family heme chaperone HemW [Chloroflexota bacterium]|nr:radical SAM family heme chaperone HemW [Chloroflexota bacterium]